QSGNDDELCPIAVDILPFEPPNDIVNRPPGRNVKLFAVMSDFTLSQVRGVSLPQFVQPLLRQRHLDTRHQVITIEQGGGTIQTSVAGSDGGELQGLRTLSLVEVDT